MGTEENVNLTELLQKIKNRRKQVKSLQEWKDRDILLTILAARPLGPFSEPWATLWGQLVLRSRNAHYESDARAVTGDQCGRIFPPEGV